MELIKNALNAGNCRCFGHQRVALILACSNNTIIYGWDTPEIYDYIRLSPQKWCKMLRNGYESIRAGATTLIE